ncbi:MAG: helix-turn-helix transcriptional regulator [Thermomicrobiales bacterium]
MQKTIRQFREELGLTQLQLANELGVTPSTIYNWERGTHEPKASQLKAMAMLFGVRMDDIDFEVEAAKSAA